MARIRTIKPEFFTSEDIVGLSPMARLLYIALWCEADREGRLPWKPKTFKLRYLPADACDVMALCGELTAAGLVVLYGDGLAFIPSFIAHQHINPREAASQLPAPDACPTRAPRVDDASARDSDVQGGREGKGKEGDKPSSSAAPNDGKPHDLQQRLGQVTDEAIEAFNASPLVKANGGVLAGVSRTVGREKRQGQVRRCLRTARAICAEQYGGPKVEPKFWQDYFAIAHADDFHAGRQPGGKGHENWRPDFEFLTREDVMLKLYDRAAEAVA
jgi:ferredoxin